MKTNKKTIIVAISLVLAFTAVLSVAMFCLPRQKVPTKPVTDDSSNAPVVIAPQTQEDLQNKFSKFGVKSVENGVRSITLFTDEQIKQSLDKIAAGERFYLTEQEAMFIINDSVRMYEESDQIVMNAWDKLPFAQNIEKHANLADPETLSECAESITVECYHGDFSEFPYKTAIDEYQKMLVDIYNIISYRFALHDSRFISAYASRISYGDTQYIYSMQQDPEKLSSFALKYCKEMRFLMTDSGALSLADYNKSLRDLFNFGYTDQKDLEEQLKYKSDYPVFAFSLEKDFREVGDYTEYSHAETQAIAIVKGRNEYETVFPTAELQAKRPEMRVDESCLEPYFKEYHMFANFISPAYYLEADGFKLREAFVNECEGGFAAVVADAALAESYEESEAEGFESTVAFDTETTLYFSIIIGHETKLFVDVSGNAFVQQVHGDKTYNYSMSHKFSKGFLSVLFDEINFALSDIFHDSAYYKEFHIKSTASLQSKLGLEGVEIPETKRILLDFDAESFNGYSYAEMVKKHGFAFKNDNGRCFYYLSNGLRLGFDIDDEYKMQNCRLEDAYYIDFFHVTGVNQSVVYADGLKDIKYVIRCDTEGISENDCGFFLYKIDMDGAFSGIYDFSYGILEVVALEMKVY